MDLDRDTAQWNPSLVELSESDLRRVEEEARLSVQSMRKSDDEAHALRLQSLKDTLTTIREGGATRLQAEKDAAAVSNTIWISAYFTSIHEIFSRSG